MKKIIILLIVMLIGVFITVTSRRCTLVIAGTVTVVSALWFGSEVHKIEDEET